MGNLRMLRRRSRRRRQNPRRPSGLARCLVERLRRPNPVGGPVRGRRLPNPVGGLVLGRHRLRTYRHHLLPQFLFACVRRADIQKAGPIKGWMH
jgi:hypothetical protein